MLWVYQSVFQSPYVYEDRPAELMSWQGFHEEVVNLAWRHPTRFVTHLSFLATHSSSPATDHVGNVALHAANVGLLAAVIAPTVGEPLALAAAALFALHPVQTEAVAYAASRSDLLVGLGILLALYGAQARRWSLLLAGVVLAALSKETGLMALPLALLWLAHAGQAYPSRRVLLASGAIIATCVLGFARQFGNVLAGPDEVSAHLTMLWRLLALVVWPVGLSIDHSWLWITPKVAAFGAIAWLGVLWLAGLHRRSWLAFGLVWALVAVLPRLLAHDAEPLHEHHLYGPMIGLSIGLTGVWPVVVGSCRYWLRALKCWGFGHAWLAPDQHWCMRCRCNESFASGSWIARQVWIRRTDPKPDLSSERAKRYATYKESHA